MTPLARSSSACSTSRRTGISTAWMWPRFSSRQSSAVFDCQSHRRADLVGDVLLNDDGSLENARWVRLAADDPLLRMACTPLADG